MFSAVQRAVGAAPVSDHGEAHKTGLMRKVFFSNLTGKRLRQQAVQIYSDIDDFPRPLQFSPAAATRSRSQMGVTLATISVVLGAVDAITTHVGLRGGRLAESNPAALWLYRRLPLPIFIVMFALASGILSLGLLQLLGPEAQAGFVAVGVLPPLLNTWLILRSRTRG